MSDPASRATDKLLSELERKIDREYRRAVLDTQKVLHDYLAEFRKEDERRRKLVNDGSMTQKAYQDWRQEKLMTSRHWLDVSHTLAEDMHNTNAIARSMVEGYMPEVYAQNHNYGVFETEKGSGLYTSYTLYDRQTVERLMRDNPELLPPPGKKMSEFLRRNKDLAWQEGQLQSVMMQSILQGESIPNMTKRIATELGEINHKSTIRYARTAVTGAQNAGRIDAYKRAQDMGISMKQMWLATLDNRTRHEHRQLDGQTVSVGEPFIVDGYEIEYPGDPKAEPFLIWNCRCSTRAIVDGLEPKARALRSYDAINGMTYDEWLEATPKSRNIESQEKRFPPR